MQGSYFYTEKGNKAGFHIRSYFREVEIKRGDCIVMNLDAGLINKSTDFNTPLNTIKTAMKEFVKTRGFEKYHDPKNLAMSIAVESAELMEIFQFVESADAWALVPERKEHIQDELSDVMLYCISMANVLGFDLTTAINKKIEKNKHKHPPAAQTA